MLFKFKQKPIVIDCFTHRPEVYTHSKINFAYKFYPYWWKELPQTYKAELRGFEVNLSTMKNCSGIVEYYKKGIILPLWTDLKIVVSDNEQKQINCFFYDLISEMKEHDHRERGSMLSEDHFHLKIMSPWRLKCKEEIPFMFIQPVWNFSDIFNMIAPPAIVDFKYQHSTNVNVFFKFENQQKEIFFKHGQPLIHMVPLSERKVELKHHLIHKDELIKMFDRNPFTENKIFHNWKKILKNTTDKNCPFHSDYNGFKNKS
jgi:hypothetical protein